MLTAGLSVLAGLRLDVPVDIGRDDARRAALDELAKPVYQEAKPSLLVRAMRWLLDRFTELLDQAGNAPGGPYGLILILVVVVLAILLIRFGVGSFVRTPATGEHAVFGEAIRSAAEHRAAADAAAAAGDWAGAVRERFRAVVRQLEEYDLIDRRPGRTADEAAVEAGHALPTLGSDLRSGAILFDEVVYGQHPASSAQDQRLRGLDEAVRSARRSRIAVGGR